jgi:hypothetical protein
MMMWLQVLCEGHELSVYSLINQILIMLLNNFTAET